MSQDEVRSNDGVSVNGVGSMVAGDDPRVIAALEKYFVALEAGRPFDRQQFLAEHADIAATLAACLDGLEFVHAAGPQVEQAGENMATDGGRPLPEGMALGDFRILREVGKGGMGVVYEAEQLSLRRRVALKVLPFAATMDSRHLQRFHNEAQAAACLHHTNIVPVFFVGCERGVHFYAMQFIDGQPLSEIIRQMRRMEKKTPTLEEDATVAYQPPGSEAASTPYPAAARTPLSSEGRRSRDYYRKVAELGMQAAEALDYAHQLGIVHRDIKPGNLMLDGRGNLWVTDFGLAHVQHSEVSLTVTGQAVGTPRYMSPEQALAKRAPVDHRTDVYSLGATLYELLTLRPAFASEDRHELLRQIAFEEPARPRRLDRAIPAELETIILKAMEKRSEDRYATAQELADDLERWLKHEPIRARRPTLLQRASKWVRRHPRTATTLATVALIAAMAWVAWDRQRLEAEAASRQVAEQAEELWRKGRLPEAEAVAHRAADLLPRFGGDDGLKRRVGEMVADYTLLRRLDDARLERINDRPDVKEFDSRLSREGFAAAFREEYGVDVLNGDEAEVLAALGRRAILTSLAEALDDWAIETPDSAESKRLVKLADALDPDPQGIAARWRRLRAPGNAAELRKLAAEAEQDPPPTVFLVRLGQDLIHASDRATGLRLLRLAQRRQPDDLWALIALIRQLVMARPEYSEESLRFLTAAQSLRPDNPVVLNNLGTVLEDLGRYEEALNYHRMAIRIEPKSANPHYNAGVALVNLKRYQEAAEEFKTATDLNPEHYQAWHNLGEALGPLNRPIEAVGALCKANSLKAAGTTSEALSRVLNHLGRFAEAEEAARLAIQLEPRYADAYYRLAWALQHQNRLTEAAEAYRRSIEFRPEPVAYYNLSLVLTKLGRRSEALEAVRQAVRLNPKYDLAHVRLARLLLDNGDPGGAAASCREAIKLRSDDADAHYLLGLARTHLGDVEGAEPAYRQAIRYRPEFAEAHCNLGQTLRRKGEFVAALAALRRGDELGRRRGKDWKYPSEQWVKEAIPLAAMEERLPGVLAGKSKPIDGADAVLLAEMCTLKKRFVAAVRLYEQAFRLNPQWLSHNLDGYRYAAAVAAIQAGCAQGEDIAALTEAERAQMRQRALAWLRDELKLWSRSSQSRDVLAALPAALDKWTKNPAFKGVREESELKKLPTEERSAWQMLWADAAALHKKAKESLSAKKDLLTPK